MSVLFKPLPLAGVTVTPAGASVTYRNFTSRVGTVGLVRVMFTGEPLQIVSTFGVTVIRGRGFYPYIRRIIDAGTFFSFRIRITDIRCDDKLHQLCLVIDIGNGVCKHVSVIQGPPVAGVTVTPAGASVTYRNFTSRVGTVGLVRVMFTGEPLQIVSTFGVTVTLAVGSTHTYAVSFMPVHFSNSESE